MNRSIRAATIADAAAIADIYRPHVTDGVVSFEMEPPDAPEMSRRIEAVTQRTPWLVSVVEGEIAGYAYASKHRERAAYQWSVEVSAYVRADARRGGIARALYEELFSILVQQGFFNAYAGITLPNDASVRFHQSLGFLPIGVFHHIGFKHGAWHDVGWYERALRPLTAPDAAPRLVTQLP